MHCSSSFYAIGMWPHTNSIYTCLAHFRTFDIFSTSLLVCDHILIVCLLVLHNFRIFLFLLLPSYSSSNILFYCIHFRSFVISSSSSLLQYSNMLQYSNIWLYSFIYFTISMWSHTNSTLTHLVYFRTFLLFTHLYSSLSLTKLYTIISYTFSDFCLAYSKHYWYLIILLCGCATVYLMYIFEVLHC